MQFLQDFTMPVGETVSVLPGLARVLAPNPSPFTYTGTQTYLVGEKRLCIIDPGPQIPAHFNALIAAIAERPVDHILVTHTHLDHSPLTKALKEKTGASTYGFGTHGSGQTWETAGLEKEAVEAGADIDFAADHYLKDGDEIARENGTIEALHTPGHTSNHMCFHWKEPGILFTGDHIMGWSTTVIAPPDGHMASYLYHLKRLLALEIKTLVPTHGPIIPNAKAFIEGLISHRLKREQQILAYLQRGTTEISPMVATLYADIDKALHPAAARSVLAHLIKLVDEGHVIADTAPSLDSFYQLA